MSDQMDYRVSTTTNSQSKVVGDKDCGISQIVIALSKNKSTKAALTLKWKELARALGADKADEIVHDKNILLDKRTAMDIVEELLYGWRTRNSKNATLSKLIEICNNAELEEVATVLENFQFGDLC